MKICSRCATRFEGPDWRCATCGFAPLVIDGYVIHAPSLAEASAGGFLRQEFELLSSLEARNFWFLGRNRLIVDAVRRYCVGAHKILEIGCGTGFVLQELAKQFPHADLYGSEIALAGLRLAKDRSGSATLLQMDADDIPYENEFDVIGAFDVLEHIEDDIRAISEIFKALKPGGHAVVTVPQHMFLWSEQDRHARHFRRYGTRELDQRLKRVGFNIDMKSSFVSCGLAETWPERICVFRKR